MERSSLYPDIFAEGSPRGREAINPIPPQEESDLAKKKKKLVFKVLIITSILTFLIILPFCDIISFYWVIIGYGGATITVFISCFALILTLPCWYLGGCCVWGVHTNKIKDHCLGPKWRWNDCLSSCYLNGWLCLCCLAFFVFLYLFGMLSIWAPVTNAEYWRFYVLDDREDPANVTSFNNDNYVYFWDSGWVVNVTAGRAVENGLLYCVFPVIANSQVPLNISTTLSVNLLIGCMYGSYKRDGQEILCTNVTDSDGAIPQCFANVRAQDMFMYVGINRLNYLFNGYDSGWKNAMRDLVKHFPEYYARPLEISSDPLIVDLLTAEQFADREQAAKESFIFLFVFIHLTICACLYCWVGCYWISSQVLEDKCFDDTLYLADDEEGHSLVRGGSRYSGKAATEPLRGAGTRTSKPEKELLTTRKDNVKRGDYDVLDGDKEVFPL